MSREYVRCVEVPAPGWVHLKGPSGTAAMFLHLGARYLKTDAVVKQHPHLFRPIEPAAKTGGS